jgi:hypothetical protein
MAKLVKRDGTQEEFQRTKAEDSLRRIGAADSIIKSTIDKVVPNDGESTSSYRNRILTELKAVAPGVASKYEVSRRLQVAKDETVVEGTVWVNPSTVRYYGWKPGVSLNVEHGSSALKVRIEESAQAGQRAIRMSPKTLGSLGATEGTRVVLSLLR